MECGPVGRPFPALSHSHTTPRPRRVSGRWDHLFEEHCVVSTSRKHGNTVLYTLVFHKPRKDWFSWVFTITNRRVNTALVLSLLDTVKIRLIYQPSINPFPLQPHQYHLFLVKASSNNVKNFIHLIHISVKYESNFETITYI